MTQNRDYWASRCTSCDASPGSPCRTVAGHVADRVHWGRPGRALSEPVFLDELDLAFQGAVRYAEGE